MASYTPFSESQNGDNKLNLVYFSNEFPSEDLSYLLGRLHIHSKHHSHPILGRFLDEASRALREEVGKLRAELSILVPEFETVTALARESELRKGPLCTSIDGVLLCVLQLGMYIGYEETPMK